MRSIDLHTHSHYSDGTSSPAEVVRRAKARGVELLVLTDHDTVDGWAEARAAAGREGLPLACGIEINTCTDDHVHILGYGIDPASAALAERLEEFRRRRRSRIGRMVERLRAAGVDIALEEVAAQARQTVGRPHVADALRRKHIVRSRQEAFQRYLSRGAPGYVEPMGPSVQEAIETIRAAGGWASLAHPGMLKGIMDLGTWASWGLEGLEVHYLAHTQPVADRLQAEAARHGLLATGGSDYHGPGTGREEIGGVSVTDGLFERLAARITPCST